jgi:cystathionine gamma-synthase/cystathionine gamma-lyase/cystathionine beta-lyase
VERVNYAGLATHPQHARARELFEGCGGVKEADALISRLKLPISAPSLGGVESLITRPATTSHAGLSPEARARLGIHDRLIRVAVGIESPDDLCADFEQALKGL